ncbi:MAG: hypothetical protein PVI81_05460, partial [Anaerolineales bacterium]
MDPQTILLIGGGLGGLLLVVGLAMTLLGERSVVEERLGRYSETGVVSTGHAEAEGPRSSFLTDFLSNLGEGTDTFDNISKNLARADLKFRPAEFIALIVISSIVVGLIGLIISGYSIFF